MSVRPSVTLCMYQKYYSVMISSLTECLKVADIRFVSKFERRHPERWRFMRLRYIYLLWKSYTKYTRNKKKKKSAKRCKVLGA